MKFSLIILTLFINLNTNPGGKAINFVFIKKLM